MSDKESNKLLPLLHKNSSVRYTLSALNNYQWENIVKRHSPDTLTRAAKQTCSKSSTLQIQIARPWGRTFQSNSPLSGRQVSSNAPHLPPRLNIDRCIICSTNQKISNLFAVQTSGFQTYLQHEPANLKLICSTNQWISNLFAARTSEFQFYLQYIPRQQSLLIGKLVYLRR